MVYYNSEDINTKQQYYFIANNNARFETIGFQFRSGEPADKTKSACYHCVLQCLDAFKSICVPACVCVHTMHWPFEHISQLGVKIEVAKRHIWQQFSFLCWKKYFWPTSKNNLAQKTTKKCKKKKKCAVALTVQPVSIHCHFQITTRLEDCFFPTTIFTQTQVREKPAGIFTCTLSSGSTLMVMFINGGQEVSGKYDNFNFWLLTSTKVDFPCYSAACRKVFSHEELLWLSLLQLSICALSHPGPPWKKDFWACSLCLVVTYPHTTNYCNLMFGPEGQNILLLHCWGWNIWWHISQSWFCSLLRSCPKRVAFVRVCWGGGQPKSVEAQPRYGPITFPSRKRSTLITVHGHLFMHEFVSIWLRKVQQLEGSLLAFGMKMVENTSWEEKRNSRSLQRLTKWSVFFVFFFTEKFSET